jgi:hypothetical protein
MMQKLQVLYSLSEGQSIFFITCVKLGHVSLSTETMDVTFLLDHYIV